MLAPKVSLSKQANPLRGPAAKTVQMALKKMLGGIGTAAYNNSKQSAALPEPTCRGMTKKVTVPESSSQQPDLDPEGVQMTEQDHNINKEARFGSLLKLLAKGVYKTPRSLKALTVGGGGGYAAGRQHGHQVGLEDGREDAASTLIDLFQKKQAFMGLGALAGMATAPNKEEEDLSIGRGALRGVGTGLGVGTGALTGGALGGLGGAGLGALLGALSRSKHEMRMGGGRVTEFYTPLAARMRAGAATGAGMGMLAGGLGGGAYGGYKGNKATKALLDKTAPISDKKKDKKDNDKDVKEAASAEFNKFMNRLVNTPKFMDINFARAGLGGAGAGAIYGALSAPRGKMLKNTLRGATVGGLAGLGTGAGVSLGGHIAGGRHPYFDMIKDPVQFHKRLSTGAAVGGGLAAGLSGLLADKAITEITGDEKKDKKDDDKDVKEAAAALQAVLRRNHSR